MRNLGYQAGDQATDGIHMWLRHQNQTELYVASLNRRDNRLVVKKKLTGGTYYELGAVPYTPAAGNWQPFTLTITGNGSAAAPVTITVASSGKQLLTVTDRGTGGHPISAPGAVGLRADRTEFEVANFQVRQT